MEDILPVAVAVAGKRSGRRPAAPRLPAGGAPPCLPDGPAVLVAIIGEPSGGRWSPVSTADEPTLEHAWKRAGVVVARYASLESPLVFGFAVVKAWHFITAFNDSSDTLAMFKACRKAESGERGVVGALSHQVLVSCALVEPTEAPCSSGLACHTDGAALGEQARRCASSAAFNVFDNTGVAATYDSLEGVLTRWVRSGVAAQEDLSRCYAWPVWAPVASAIVRRKWMLDVTAVVQRATQWRWKAPVQPPDTLVRLYKRWLREAGGIPGASWESRPVRGRPPVYGPHRQAAHLQVSQFLSSQRNVGGALEAARRALAIADRDVAQGGHGAAEVAGGSAAGMPLSWSTVARARAILDVSAMLAQRQCMATGRFRYLFFDASPQRSGREVFCCAERLIEREALRESDGRARGAVGVVDRRLPVCGLGQGRTSLMDKVICLVHQLWLEYGPSATDVRRACRAVRCCLSDMGVEFGICDFPDIVDQCIDARLVGVPVRTGSASGASASSGAAPVSNATYLFPLALKVPGIRHIVDWVLQRAVERCPWWPQWQTQCKQLMQCMHSAGQRERLQQWLREQYDMSEGRRAELVAVLTRAPPSFAAWRWFTLADVVASFLAMEPALRIVAGSAHGGARLFESRQGAGAAICDTVLSQSFSDRARGLRDLMQPLVRATQELGRCTCHDESDPAARSCPWKGCIGPTLATIVASAVEQLSALRSCRTLSAASSGSGTGGGALGVGRECDLDIACAAELAMSDLLTKFHWVNQPPYLVWQARPDSRESAARFRAAAVQRTCLVWGMVLGLAVWPWCV